MSHSLIDRPTGKKRSFFALSTGLVLLILFFILSRIFFASTQSEDAIEAAKAENRVEIVLNLKDDDDNKLHYYDWADREKKTVRIPIDRAMELTIPVLNAVKPHAVLPAPPEAAEGETPNVNSSGEKNPDKATPEADSEKAKPEESPTPESSPSSEEAAPSPNASYFVSPIRA